MAPHNKKADNKKADIKTIVVGKIHAKWCRHCKSLGREWPKMKADIKKRLGHKYNIVFSDIEQTDEKLKVDKINNQFLTNSNEKLSVQGGYPTLYKIVGGKLEYYNGNRTASELANWYSLNLSSLNHNKSEKSVDFVNNKKPGNYYSSFSSIFGGKSKRTKKIKNKTKKSKK